MDKITAGLMAPQKGKRVSVIHEVYSGLLAAYAKAREEERALARIRLPDASARASARARAIGGLLRAMRRRFPVVRLRRRNPVARHLRYTARGVGA